MRCNPPLSPSLSLSLFLLPRPSTNDSWESRLFFIISILFSSLSRHRTIEYGSRLNFNQYRGSVPAIRYDARYERSIDLDQFGGEEGSVGAIINRFPRQCAETRKVRRGEVEKRKEETRRDASLRYAYVLTHGNAGCCFLFGHRRHPAA